MIAVVTGYSIAGTIAIIIFLVWLLGIVLDWQDNHSISNRYPPDRNCKRCGRPYSQREVDDKFPYPYPVSGRTIPHSICLVCCKCNSEFFRVLKVEAKKYARRVNCHECNGTKKIKGYPCVTCEGRGYFSDSGIYRAFCYFKKSAEWREYLLHY